MSTYDEIPMESGPGPMLVSIFAVPLRPFPRYARAARSWAGANPLRWLVVVVGALGYLAAVVVYTAFALFPAVSYLLLILITLPLIVAVYAWKGLSHVADAARAGSRDDDAGALRSTRP